MNSSVKKYLGLLTLASIGFLGAAHAQRGEHRNGGGQWGLYDRGSSAERHSGGYNQSASNNNRQFGGTADRQSRQSTYDQRTSSYDQRTASVTPSRQARVFSNGGSYAGSNTQRTINRGNNTAYNRPQVNRNVTVYNNTRINNAYRSPVSRSVYPQRVVARSYSYLPRRYVYVGAPRYAVLPHGYINIHFGGYPYYYYNGLFFNHYNGFYEPVYAPVGIHVTIIPGGCFPVFVGPTQYYYYEGIYYRQYTNNDYEVVDAPVGAIVLVLPKGAKAVTVNGEKFYEFNGTYYKEGMNERSQVVYTVVGKYGNINNTNEVAPPQGPASLQMGDVVTALPDGSKEVVINGEHFYVSPDNTYYKAQSTDGEITYKIVGTQTNN